MAFMQNKILACFFHINIQTRSIMQSQLRFKSLCPLSFICLCNGHQQGHQSDRLLWRDQPSIDNTLLLNSHKHNRHKFFSTYNCSLLNSHETPNNVLVEIFQSPDSVTPLTPEEKLLIVKSEFELMKQEGMVRLPNKISDEDWQQIIEQESRSGRMKLYDFLFIKECRRENGIIKKKERKIKLEYRNEILRKKIEENPDFFSSQYGLWKNTFITKYTDSRMRKSDNYKLINARLYGQPIVIDTSYDSLMIKRAKKDLSRQIAMGIGWNKQQLDPFYIHMTSFNVESETSRNLLKNIPNLLDDDYLLDTHSESYLNVFPRDQLVYLTPHCEEVLEEFDHDAVYIIGGLVDCGTHEPVSMAKAKRENIKMRKFPLDRYLEWGSGSKSLTINQVLAIMGDLKSSGSWVHAFGKHIPPRKLMKHTHDGDSIRQTMTKHKSPLHEENCEDGTTQQDRPN